MRPSYLNAPKAPKEYLLDMTRLDGGLNLWELDYRIAANQSPDIENMLWTDGALGSRKGQEYMYEGTLGEVYASHERLFSDMAIFHAGTKLYKMDLESGVATEIYTGVPENWGTFFVFKDNLYYKNYGEYLRIKPTFVVEEVAGYEPIMTINLLPNGTGGDNFEAENRIAAGKWFHYTADGTSKDYYLPIKGLDATAVIAEVNGVAKVETTDFTVDRTNGKVTFNTAPSQSSPPLNNNVKIKVFKTTTDTTNSIMDCRIAVTYGEGNDIGVVMGGPTKQPNAYFWSGSNSVVDPSYFPFDYYNFAGNTEEAITGLAKQQGILVIFKENSIGKTSFSPVTNSTTGETVLQMPYIAINSQIGCDLPRTIQLVSNNLVFCNTKNGVYMVSDTSTSNENTVIRLSRNVNGTDLRPGLLDDVRAVASAKVTAIDDNRRYRLCANGNIYAWDYILSPFTGSEERLSWFYLTNFDVSSWLKDLDSIYYGTPTGQWVRQIYAKNDFGNPISKKFRFATQYFNTYERLKDVHKVIFAVRSDTDTVINITYDTDYDSRPDATPIYAYSYKVSPRNLAFRILSTIKYAKSNVRRPRALHVRHFSMTLTNNTINTDMSLVGAQIFYSYSTEDR